MELNSVQGSYRIQEPTFSGPDKFYDIMLLVNGPPELVNIEEPRVGVSVPALRNQCRTLYLC